MPLPEAYSLTLFAVQTGCGCVRGVMSGPFSVWLWTTGIGMLPSPTFRMDLEPTAYDSQAFCS